MKYSKEWHTCDRCGEKYNHISTFGCGYEYEVKEYWLREQSIGLKHEKKEYVLCSKCRKEFERFMRNEKDKE